MVVGNISEPWKSIANQHQAAILLQLERMQYCMDRMKQSPYPIRILNLLQWNIGTCEVGQKSVSTTYNSAKLEVFLGRILVGHLVKVAWWLLNADSTEIYCRNRKQLNSLVLSRENTSWLPVARPLKGYLHTIQLEKYSIFLTARHLLKEVRLFSLCLYPLGDDQ